VLGFVHIEKTAGMSVHRIFQRSFGGRYCIVERWRLSDDWFSAADYRKLRLFYPRLEALGGHWIKPYGDLREAIPDLRYFTFLREPLARCASHYQHQTVGMGRSVPFEEWIAQDEYRNYQVRKLVGGENADAALRVLREEFLCVGLAERFDESMVLLRHACGGRLDIRHRPENVAGDPSLKDRLLADPGTRALLEEGNRADLELYQRVRDGLYPEQRKACGAGLEAEVERFLEANHAYQASGAGPTLRLRLAQARRGLVYKPAVQIHRRLFP
jgi:hypothetical protein